MKRSVSAAVLFGVALTIGTGQARAQSVNFGVGGGLTIPIGDFGDVAKTGWHGLGIIGYQLQSGLGLRGDFYYGQNNSDPSGAKFKLAGGLANVSYSFSGKSSITPYVIGSIGYFNFKADGGGASSSESKVAFGGGGGIKFKAGSDSHFFVESRYLTINTSGSNANFIPITVGITFGS
jgi:hypothetical protein